jgi:type VII secretion-associated serine protease mycosin
MRLGLLWSCLALAVATPAFGKAARPNDPEYFRQEQYFERIGLLEAWEAGLGRGQIRVAVVDTGVDAAHPDLTGRVLHGYDFANDDADADDDQWHGTWVAAIVAANTNNGVGIAGVAPSAQILPVKVLDAQGNGTDEDIAAGIRWAADHEADVINLSLRAASDAPVIRNAVEHALARDAVVVAASGNSGSTVPQYPAAYPGVVAVAATDGNGHVASFSARGPWIDIAAPGVNITSARSRSLYEAMSGTSYAAPIVAGVAALARSVDPLAPASEIVSRLLETARDAGPVGIDPSFGHGVVDAFAVVAASRAPRTPPPPGLPAPVLPEPPSPPALAEPSSVPWTPLSQPPFSAPAAANGPAPGPAPAQAPSASPEGRRAGDAVFAARVIDVRQNGTASVPIACRSRNTHCRGTATFRWSGRVIGRAPFSLAATERRTIAVPVNRHIVRRLRQKKTLAVRGIVNGGAAPGSTRLLILRRVTR